MGCPKLEQVLICPIRKGCYHGNEKDSDFVLQRWISCSCGREILLHGTAKYWMRSGKKGCR